MSKTFYKNLAILVCLDLCAVISARSYVMSDKIYFLIFAILFLASAGYVFTKVLKEEITVVANALWVALGTILVAIVSYFLFDEKITLLQCTGMFIAILGIIIMETSNKSNK